MPSFFSKRVVIIGLLLIAAMGIGIGLAFIWRNKILAPAPIKSPTTNISAPNYQVIGSSVEGRKIEAYTYGSGKKRLLFVGGIHGGYEWNSVVLAYAFMDYLGANPDIIPRDLNITVIPSLNPDGVYKVIHKEGRFTASDVPSNASTEPGRFNAHKVDLNRNFDCNWKRESMWKGNVVSGGSAAFSEPESKALKNFVLENKPEAVLFWHSQANGVYASECRAGILPRTLDIMNAYARGSGYPAVKTFNAYEITGDADGWLASIGIPAISVELKTHKTVEWERNLAGIKALLGYFNF